jgi:tRNA dimethylallyltransferase
VKLLVAIVGPTAVGKTAFSIQLAQHFNTAIISADSRQIFKELTIGTAKPNSEELLAVPHYFINHVSIKENYNAGQYEAEALQVAEKLFQQKDIVILCGGSGLYVNALCNGFDEVPKGNEAIRNKLNNIFNSEGITALQNMLQEKDAVYYRQVDLNNPQRILRALEVCLTTNKPYSSFRKATTKQRPFKILTIGLNNERAKLYVQIDKRVDAMMQQGLLKEVEGLLPYQQNNALQTVGYTELFEYFNGKHTLAQAVELIKQHSRNYAKRQLTWFNKNPQTTWLQPHEIEKAITIIEDYIQR